MGDYTKKYVDILDKYNSLLCVIVGGSKPRLTNGRLWMQFDCQAIKSWLKKNEPLVMKAWEDLQEMKLEEEEEDE